MVKEEVSLTLLLHCSPTISIDDFVYSLQDFETLLSIPEPISTQCSQVCYEFQTSLKMFNKFDHIWQKLEVKDKSMVTTEEKLKKVRILVYTHSSK